MFYKLYEEGNDLSSFGKKNVLDKELNYYEDILYLLVLILMAIIVLIDLKNRLSPKTKPKI